MGALGWTSISAGQKEERRHRSSPRSPLWQFAQSTSKAKFLNMRGSPRKVGMVSLGMMAKMGLHKCGVGLKSPPYPSDLGKERKWVTQRCYSAGKVPGSDS